MMNQNIIVGRIVNKPILMENDDVKHTCLTLSVPRSYKNELGEYEVDFINVVLNNGIAVNTTEYCHQGDLIGIWSQHMQYKEIYCILPLIYM